MGDGAQVNVLSLQDWADDAVHLARDAVRVGRDLHQRQVGGAAADVANQHPPGIAQGIGQVGAVAQQPVVQRGLGFF